MISHEENLFHKLVDEKLIVTRHKYLTHYGIIITRLDLLEMD